MPEMLTGLSAPVRPTNIRLVRERGENDRGEKLPPERIVCHPIYAGHDGETYWWAIRTVTDDWINPATDTIVSDPLPDDTALCGVGEGPAL